MVLIKLMVPLTSQSSNDKDEVLTMFYPVQLTSFSPALLPVGSGQYNNRNVPGVLNLHYIAHTRAGPKR